MSDPRTIMIEGLLARGASAEAVSFAVSILAGDHPLITRSRSKHAEAQAKYMENKKKGAAKKKLEDNQRLIIADQHDHNPCIISYLTPVKVMDVEEKGLPEKQVTLNQVPVSRARARKKPLATLAAPFFDDWPDDYGEQFWQAYPKKNQKTKTIDLLTKTRARGEVSWSELTSGLSRYSDSLPAWQSWCWPVKWLTEERWNSTPGEEDQYGRKRSRSELIQTAERIVDSFGTFDEGIRGKTEILRPAGSPNARLLSNGGSQ